MLVRKRNKPLRKGGLAVGQRRKKSPARATENLE
jgi:hypothetical protein